MEDRLATFLREFLLKFNISTDIVAKLVSNKNLTTWIKAFTHLSWDPNYGHNYEELELLGDAIVKPIFIEYCMSKYEGVDRSQLSELVIMYLKGFTMAKMSQRYGLSTYVRTRIRSPKIDEDVFESFFGALYTVGNVEFPYGTGYVLCSRVLKIMLEETVRLSLEEAAKINPRTRLDNYFSRIGGKLEYHLDQLERGNMRVRLELNNDAIEALRRMGINVSSPTLVTRIGNKKKTLNNEAYKEALNRLEALGLTEDRVRLERKKIDEITFGDVYVKAKTKAKKYKDIELKMLSYALDVEEGKTYYCLLLGVKSDDGLDVLSLGEGDTTNIAKLDALNKYLKSN